MIRFFFPSGVNIDFDIISIVALGKMGDKNQLDEGFNNIEKPNTRKPYEEFILNVNSFK